MAYHMFAVLIVSSTCPSDVSHNTQTLQYITITLFLINYNMCNAFIASLLVLFSMFSLSGDGASLGMAVTLANRQNNPRLMSLHKIMLCFGAIISATIFRIRGNTPKGSTLPCVKFKKQTQEDMLQEF